MYNTTDELLKVARRSIFYNLVWATDEVLVRCLFDELQCREKRSVKKRSTNHYQDWLYYIATDGRLARVPNTMKNPLGTRLIKEKTLMYDNYGLLRAEEVIDKGQFVRVRPLLDELDPAGRWNEEVKDRIASFLDGGKECKMVIDREFGLAYEPEYDEDFCLEGDLVTSQSCMSGQGDAAESFYGNIDGCYVVRFENDDGEQVGRCIMYEYEGQRHFIRIYAYKDYARCALRLLRKEMKEGDLFGRCERIPNMKLKAHFDCDTSIMYLDGEYYALNVETMTIVNTRDYPYTLRLTSTGNENLWDYLDEEGFVSCPECGDWFRRDDGIYAGEDYYCCEDCAESAGCVRCAECGEFVSNDDCYEYEGETFCSKSCLSRRGLRVCRRCWKVIPEDEAQYINGNCYCCEECAVKDGNYKCEACGEWRYTLRRDITTGQMICEMCANERGLELGYVAKQEEVKND